MEMYELIYCSMASPDLDEKDIAGILKKARDFNSKNNISGCLLFHNHEFIQILEGDKKIIKDLVEKISKDTRHSNIMVLAEHQITTRIFDQWSMAYHKIGNHDSVNFESLLFVNNFLTLSEMIAKPTHASRVFWYMAKQLLKE